MKIDLSPILAGAKNSVDFSYPLSPNPEQAPPGVAFPKPFEVSGKITNNAGYMALSVQADVAYQTECARCLKLVDGALAVAFNRTIALPDMLEGENDDDYAVIEENAVDIDIPLLEEILLSIPSKILCSENCKGLCPKCGKDLNAGPCSCGDKEIDPRLAVLAKLLEDEQE